MNLGTRTIEVPVSEGNLHAELETLFRRWGFIHDDEKLTAIHYGNLTVRDGAADICVARLEIAKEEVN